MRKNLLLTHVDMTRTRYVERIRTIAILTVNSLFSAGARPRIPRDDCDGLGLGRPGRGRKGSRRRRRRRRRRRSRSRSRARSKKQEARGRGFEGFQKPSSVPMLIYLRREAGGFFSHWISLPMSSHWGLESHGVVGCRHRGPGL